MQFDEALRYLLSLGHETLTLKLGLRTTELLLNALGEPQTTYAAVQIAGTNGKGSTAVVLDSICRAAGITTGLYTSPHLVSITERIKICGRDILEAAFAEAVTAVRTVGVQLVTNNELPALPTFFEHVTSAALLAFKQAGIELAILETGLGGRLDSTSVAQAETVGITPIDLDHQEYLGDTLAEIAAEKAAIIRPGTKAIIAPQAPAALEVILKRCKSVGVTPLIDGCEVDVVEAKQNGKLVVTFKTAGATYENVQPGLRGRHQLTNISLAILLAEALRGRGFAIDRAAIIEGVQRATHPGRLEFIAGAPSVLFDGAHNPAGILALRQYLDEFVAQPLTIVFGAMREKNLEAMAELLFPRAQQLILTSPENPRAADEVLLHKLAGEINELEVIVEPSAKKAMLTALARTPPHGLVCVTGSLYLIGEIKEALFK